MRVVYDTNVAATIIFRRGEFLKLKQSVTSGQITVITSEFILDELAEVLRMRLGLTKQRAKVRVRAYARITRVVQPTIINSVVRDPDDDHIIAAAVAGKADCIVTLDKDLLVLKKHKNIRIVKPSELVPQ